MDGTCCRLVWKDGVGSPFLINFLSCPKWGEHRKEKEPKRGTEKRGAQERKTAKVRERKEGEERQPSEPGLWFQPSRSVLSLARSLHLETSHHCLNFFSCYSWLSICFLFLAIGLESTRF